MSAGPSTSSTPQQSGFPLARKGYDRAAVDEFAQHGRGRMAALESDVESLTVEVGLLRSALAESKAHNEPADYSSLGGRARDLLRIAEEQARDVTDRAVRDGDQSLAQVQLQTRRLRENAAAEVAEIKAQELAEVAALRHQGELDAATQHEKCRAETGQLLTAARGEAEAVRTEAEQHARCLVQRARLEAQGLVGQATTEAATIRAQIAELREQTVAELRQAHDETTATTQQQFAEATEFHRRSAQHLAQEIEEAARRRTESLAEAERVKIDTTREAEAIIGRARQQAATIDERARQEFIWRKRQMRTEHELLARRKQAMLRQLTSLSALAVETAENLPDVPELLFGDESPELAEPEPASAR